MSRGLVVVTLSSHVDSMVLLEEYGDEYVSTRYSDGDDDDVRKNKKTLSLSRFSKDLKGMRLRNVQTESTGMNG